MSAQLQALGGRKTTNADVSIIRPRMGQGSVGSATIAEGFEGARHQSTTAGSGAGRVPIGAPKYPRAVGEQAGATPALSDVSQGVGWWQASDGLWYPPKESDEAPAPGWWLAADGRWYPPVESADPPEPGWWLAADGKWYPPESPPGDHPDDAAVDAAPEPAHADLDDAGSDPAESVESVSSVESVGSVAVGRAGRRRRRDRRRDRGGRRGRVRGRSPTDVGS